MQKMTILVHGAPSEFQERINSSLGKTYCFEWFDAPEAIMARLETGPAPDALLIRPCPDRATETEILRQTHRLYPDLPAALLESTSSSACYSTLESHAVGSAIPPHSHLTDWQLEMFFQHLIERDPTPGLARFFPPDHSIHKERLTDHSIRAEIFSAISNEFKPRGCVDSYDLQLVFEEILNNALLHAFRTPRGLPKYSSGNKISLDERDEIHVEWGGAVAEDGSACSALCISDNQGLLAPQMAWNRFFRQTSLKGILDTNGRGLYLVHMLTTLTAITIWPGHRTEIMTLFCEPRSTEKNNPIGIRVIQNDA